MYRSLDTIVGDPNEGSVDRIQALLMTRAEMVHGFVRQRIPAAMSSYIAVDDVLQDIWLTVFHHDHPDEVLRLVARGDLDTWLLTVARRKLVDTIRSALGPMRGGGKVVSDKRRGKSKSQWGHLARAASRQRTPSSEEAAVEATTAVQDALDSLPENYRKAVELYHFEGLPCDDVARIMDRSPPAVRGILHRAMRKLRVQMGDASSYFSDGDSAVADATGQNGLNKPGTQ